jgi:NAD(P)-dependent dehydrogenase (short-subunit alcohol dehydrogenase family)
MDPDQKIALVTGANKGIGKEIARQLAAKGAFVLLGARDRKRGEQAEVELQAQGLPVQCIALDVTDQRSVDQAAAQVAQKYGKLDILVNNAGIALDWVAPSELDPEVLKETYETNVFGTFRVTKAMLPLLKKSKAGRIVNMSSALGSMTLAAASAGPFQGANHLMAYCSSKSALNALTLALAKDLKSKGIKVNAANPGYVATDMNDNKGVKTVEQGAATPVRLALLPDDGPTGGCFSDEGVVPW